MQTLAVWGIFQDYYSNEIEYYFIGFFIIFYIFWIVDIIKAQKNAIIQSKYFKKIMSISSKKVNNHYYIDEETFMINTGKHTSPLDDKGITSFYTVRMVMLIFLPLILLGKFAIAIGVLSARYLPNSHFILYGSILFLGTLFFIMGLVGFLTYLKLDLSEDEEKLSHDEKGI